MAQAQTATRGILKKITLKDIGAMPDIEKLIAYKAEHGEKANMPLASIYGLASTYRPGETAMGPFVRFIGQFKAVNVESGETFVSGQCIMPGAAPDMIFGALNALGDEGGSVEFGFNIGARYDASAAVKYIYSVEQIIETGKLDPLQALEDKLTGTAQLSAPAEATAEPAAAATADDKGNKGGKTGAKK